MSQKKRFIAYYRVSTARQGASGLGLEAQKKGVSDYLGGGAGVLAGEFLEIESGRRADRPQLAAALQAYRQHQATLVIAKLDRLARDAHFLLGLEKAGVDFVACDMPSANRLTLGILALVAEEEARAISGDAGLDYVDCELRRRIAYDKTTKLCGLTLEFVGIAQNAPPGFFIGQLPSEFAGTRGACLTIGNDRAHRIIHFDPRHKRSIGLEGYAAKLGMIIRGTT